MESEPLAPLNPAIPPAASPDAPAFAMLSAREKVSYGLGDAASCVVFESAISLLPHLHTDIYGIPPASMGAITFCARVVDASVDPLIGAAVDRTSTSHGRFRPYLLALALPFGAAAAAAFSTPPAAAPVAYAGLSFAVLMILFSAINIPYCALGAALTPDPKERISINGYRFTLAQVGGALPLLWLPGLAASFGGKENNGYGRGMAVFGALAAGMWLLCFFGTKERVRQAEASGKGRSAGADLRDLAKNGQWRLVAAEKFIILIAAVMRGGATPYYVRWVMGEGGSLEFLFGVTKAASLLGCMMAPLVTQRVCSLKAYRVQCALGALMMGAIAFVRRPVWVYVLSFFSSLFVSLCVPISWGMAADAVDFVELETGNRLTALAFSCMLFILKLGMATGGAMLGWVLAASGYDSAAETQSPEATQAIVLLFTWYPCIGYLGVAALMTLYRLNSNRCVIIAKALAEKRKNTDWSDV